MSDLVTGLTLTLTWSPAGGGATFRRWRGLGDAGASSECVDQGHVEQGQEPCS